MTAPAGTTALIIGASRGLGYALAAGYLARGWQVTATAREAGRTGLHQLARSSAGRLAVETAGITETVADVPADTFVRLMVTNALSPMRVVETLRALLLMAPGWVRTDPGGPAAPPTPGQSIPGAADTIEAQATKGGLQYLDYQGQTVRW